MSKITNDGLTRYGTGCFIAAVPYDSSGHQRINGISLLPPSPCNGKGALAISMFTLIPSGLTSRILTCTVLKGHWRCLF